MSDDSSPKLRKQEFVGTRNNWLNWLEKMKYKLVMWKANEKQTDSSYRTWERLRNFGPQIFGKVGDGRWNSIVFHCAIYLKTDGVVEALAFRPPYLFPQINCPSLSLANGLKFTI